MARCVDCCNLNLDCKKNDYTNEYLCDICTGYKAPDNQDCPLSDGFTEAYNRSDEEKRRALGISDGCFIATMACNLLGKSPENDKYLQIFKDFKRNYLMKNEKFYDYLYLYEDLGPAIAHKIMAQRERASRIAKSLYYIFFPEIIKEIKEGHNSEAFKKYVDIVKVLTKACNFTIERRQVDTKNANQGPKPIFARTYKQTALR